MSAEQNGGKLTMTIGKEIEQKKLLHQLWLTFQVFDSKSCVHHPMLVFFFFLLLLLKWHNHP